VPALRWNELTRQELRRTLPEAVVVLPTAATEQHGPHLATGHDTVIVEEIARRAAERAGEVVTIVVAPALPFGSSDHHLPFGGTLSLRTETYLAVLKDLLRSMVTAGARNALVLNGHGGNHELNELAVRDIARESDDVTLAAGSWWGIAAPALAADGRFAGVRVPGHAGQAETAMMLALDPARVREDRPARQIDPSVGTVIPGARIEGEVPWTRFDGYTDSPAAATVDLGALALEVASEAVATALLKLAGNAPRWT
jgi:creatinine amidohydrolase